ncbi:MAG: hypothetical protein WAX07_10115 [Candidatus Altiarchaeia archaeon]
MPQVTVNIPEELNNGFKELKKEEVDALVSNALRERLSEQLMFKEAGELLKDSEITDDIALRWGRELKEKAAKRKK